MKTFKFFQFLPVGPGLSSPGGAAASSWQEAQRAPWPLWSLPRTQLQPALFCFFTTASCTCHGGLKLSLVVVVVVGASHLLYLSLSYFPHLYSCNP